MSYIHGIGSEALTALGLRGPKQDAHLNVPLGQKPTFHVAVQESASPPNGGMREASGRIYRSWSESG